MPYILGDQFHMTFSHHSSVKALWEDLWKQPVSDVLDHRTEIVPDVD